MNVDSPVRALAVAACIALTCSVMVASAVYLLRPLQTTDSVLERGRVILSAAGLLPDGDAGDAVLLAAYLDLDVRIVQLGTDELTTSSGAHVFDHWLQQTGDEPVVTTVSRAPVYLARRDGQLDRIVFPVDGAGMWSTIYAYIALRPDLTTIADIVFLRHGETPGIGDRIEESSWRQLWQGKRLFDESGNPALRVVRGAQKATEIDLISGASVTSEAVGEMVRTAFDHDGYGPLVRRWQREDLN
jgi:Na+-transporting NADH:ubiquinone oxidoreductase subunit C